VAARVTRLLGGGLMEVVGARETRVNGETQIVLVQGVARDRDIDADNTIMSTSLAEARIELYGEGVLADKQRPGWLARILDNVWPF
jgi:flagellar L-ring protein FlgH